MLWLARRKPAGLRVLSEEEYDCSTSMIGPLSDCRQTVEKSFPEVPADPVAWNDEYDPHGVHLLSKMCRWHTMRITFLNRHKTIHQINIKLHIIMFNNVPISVLCLGVQMLKFSVGYVSGDCIFLV